MRFYHFIAATALFLASCGEIPVVQADPKFAAATPVTKAELLAGNNNKQALENALTNTTHYYVYKDDRQVRYLGPNGKALFLVDNGARVIEGEWAVKFVLVGLSYDICIMPGVLPKYNLSGHECFGSPNDFYSSTQHLVKGDVMDLQKKIK